MYVTPSTANNATETETCRKQHKPKGQNTANELLDPGVGQRRATGRWLAMAETFRKHCAHKSHGISHTHLHHQDSLCNTLQNRDTPLQILNRQKPLKRKTMTQANQERVLQNIFMTVGVDALSEPRMVEFVNTVSAPLAARMLAQIGLDKTTEPFKLLDNGAGLGVVAAEIQKTVNKDVLAQSSIISADFSESTVEFVKTRIEQEGWVNTEAKVVDAQVGEQFRCTVLTQLADEMPRKLDSQTTSLRI